MTRKTALITGVTGQDGAYLAEFLLDKAVMAVVGFSGRIMFDCSKPDGRPRNLLDVSRREFGRQPHSPLCKGIGLAYRDFPVRHGG